MINNRNILVSIDVDYGIHWEEGQGWVTFTDNHNNKLGFQGVNGERWPVHYVRYTSDFHNLASLIAEVLGLKVVQVESERRGHHSFRFE